MGLWRSRSRCWTSPRPPLLQLLQQLSPQVAARSHPGGMCARRPSQAPAQQLLVERLGGTVQRLASELHAAQHISEPKRRRKCEEAPKTLAGLKEKHRRERKNLKEAKRKERRRQERAA